MAFRGFVAVEVPAGPPLRALLQGLDDLDAGIRTVAPENLHLTLAFLGDVDDARADDVAAALDEAAEGLAPFTLDLQGVGAFPPRGAPRVIWAGLGDDAARARLEDLARRVRDALTARDISFDTKPFRAHATLGRVKRPRQVDAVRAFLAAKADWRGGTLDVMEAALKRSTLTPRGPIYETVHAAPLEARGP